MTIKQIAEERRSKLVEVEKDYQLNIRGHSLEGQSIVYHRIHSKTEYDKLARSQGNDGKSITVNLPLLGRYQAENGCTAFADLTKPEKPE